MILQAEIPWDVAAKVWGPLGVVFVLAIVGALGAAKWFKSTLEGTIADARKERDAARQYNEVMSTRFLESLDRRDEVMEKGFDEVLRELRSNGARRK